MNWPLCQVLYYRVLSALTTAETLALTDLQAPDQSAQHAAAQHYDDSSVISYVCQQVPVIRCVNLYMSTG